MTDCSRTNVPGRGHTTLRSPHTSSGSSNWPLALTIAALAALSFAAPLMAFHGRHENASPPTRRRASLFRMRRPLLRSNPVSDVASMAVAGAVESPRTSRSSKFVWVSSLDWGPRSGTVGLCVCARETRRDVRLDELLLRWADGIEKSGFTAAHSEAFDGIATERGNRDALVRRIWGIEVLDRDVRRACRS